MKRPAFAPLVALALATGLSAETTTAVARTPAPQSAPAETAADAPATSAADKELDAKRREQELLALENKLEAERLTRETNVMRAEITRLKMERELMAERQAFDAAKREDALKRELADVDAERERVGREGELAKAKAEKLTNELKVVQNESSIEISRLQNEISRIETAEKRDSYSGSDPTYLKNPLREDGMLVISDRRIALNGMISTETADYITERIHFWNNKDRELPIFIVIDSSPGGSVMAGYRILKAMESSDAPIHVVVKSFAASMAACITTLAQESYAYPNAVLLHHQISSRIMGQLNLTQQREFHEESQRWWVRLGTPVAEKMGITTDELIRRMYERSTSGDWSEFAEDAAKLKWVKHIVHGIEETSVTKDPDSKPAAVAAVPGKPALVEQVDPDGRPFAWLPRLEPKDVYFLYNPDGYYRTR